MSQPPRAGNPRRTTKRRGLGPNAVPCSQPHVHVLLLCPCSLPTGSTPIEDVTQASQTVVEVRLISASAEFLDGLLVGPGRKGGRRGGRSGFGVGASQEQDGGNADDHGQGEEQDGPTRPSIDSEQGMHGTSRTTDNRTARRADTRAA